MRSFMVRAGRWGMGAMGIALLYGAVGPSLSPGAATSGPADSLGDRYRQGIAHFKAGRRGEALVYFEAVSAASTGYLQLCATNMIGQIARLEGRSADAQTAFARLAEQAQAIIEAGKDREKTILRAALLQELAGHYQLEIAEEEQKWDQVLAACDRLTTMVARDPRASGFRDLPILAEKRARLHWRLGRREEALEQFHAWLERWPAHPRAAMVRRSALSLQHVQPWDEPKFAFRFSPLSIPPPETRHGAALQTGRPLLADLPEPPRPELEALDSLLNPLPPTNAWRAAWVLEKGWMLCEADRWEEAAKLWAELAGPSPSENAQPWRAIRDYAELSRAVWLYRTDRLNEAGEAAMEVLARAPRGHVPALANSIRAAVGRRADLVRTGMKCQLKTLE